MLKFIFLTSNSAPNHSNHFGRPRFLNRGQLEAGIGISRISSGQHLVSITHAIAIAIWIENVCSGSTLAKIRKTVAITINCSRRSRASTENGRCTPIGRITMITIFIDDFQRWSVTVSGNRPWSIVIIVELMNDIPTRIPENNFLTTIRERSAGPLAHDVRSVAVDILKLRGVSNNQAISSRGQSHSSNAECPNRASIVNRNILDTQRIRTRVADLNEFKRRSLDWMIHQLGDFEILECRANDGRIDDQSIVKGKTNFLQGIGRGKEPSLHSSRRRRKRTSQQVHPHARLGAVFEDQLISNSLPSNHGTALVPIDAGKLSVTPSCCALHSQKISVLHSDGVTNNRAILDQLEN